MVYLTSFLFSPHGRWNGLFFWERTAGGLDVFRVFCRGPECVNVECTKKKKPTRTMHWIVIVTMVLLLRGLAQRCVTVLRPDGVRLSDLHLKHKLNQLGSCGLVVLQQFFSSKPRCMHTSAAKPTGVFLQISDLRSTRKLRLCFYSLLSLEVLPRSCLGSEGTRQRVIIIIFFVSEENRLCF